ncbi:MAG: PD40 domain-containing protein [Spirochaetota bacterium]|nr:MAG: PD40 domain-containing protein [Spirochaetota bacterium]
MRGNIYYIVIIAALLLFFGCTKSVKLEETPTKIQEPEPVQTEEVDMEQPIVEIPETMPEYSGLELEIVDIQQLEETYGAYNSYNPKFSFNERYIAFEANLETFKKISIYGLGLMDILAGKGLTINKIMEVSLEESIGDTFTEDLFESGLQESFNYEFSWFPQSSSFIFTSNAGMGDYNLFIGAIDGEDAFLKTIVKRLHPKQYGSYYMMTEEVHKDGQAKVSPDGKKIVFTSGRTGSGDLYILYLDTGTLKRLTFDEETDLFPQWSPDGRDIVYTTGGKHSHDIHIIRNAGEASQSHEVLVKWFFDDVMPKFSPDGTKISFYTTYNKERDPFNTKRWGILIIPSDGSAPKAGNELIDYYRVDDVVKDNSQATAWFPDSKHIIFAKNIETDYNPIYIYNVETREERIVETGTDINHDITVSPHGLVSFRAQVLGWDRIFIASTTYFQEYIKLNIQNYAED